MIRQPLSILTRATPDGAKSCRRSNTKAHVFTTKSMATDTRCCCSPPAACDRRFASGQTRHGNPIDTLGDAFRVIAMDQRNAGHSTAPIHSSNGWHSYTTDHIALMDQLGIERAHVLGGCIGGSYCLGDAGCTDAGNGGGAAATDRPRRRQPSGVLRNVRQLGQRVATTASGCRGNAWDAFRERMYGGDFVFNVSRDFVRQCSTPMLVLLGNDRYHPSVTSREIADLAPNAQLVER